MQPRRFHVETEQQRERFAAFIQRQQPPFQVELGPLRKQRSVTQNKRLWALHALASEITGYSPEEMHEHALCRHFGFDEKQVTDPFTGELIVKRIPLKRSSTRDTKEFRDFMDATETWYGAEFGIWLGVDD